MTRTLHPTAVGTDLTLSGTIAAAAGTVSGALGVGGAVAIGGAATIASGTVTGNLGIGGTITGIMGTVTGNWGVGGTVIAVAGTVSGALGVAGALSTSGTVSAAAGTVTAALGVGGTVTAANVNIVGATGLVKQAAGVGSVATLVNADVSASAAITPDKLSGPLFSYYRNASSNNVTGNGTVYTCLFDTATVSNANYATGTGIFTAPAAGKYLFVAHVGVASGSSSGTQGVVQLVTTSQSYRYDLNPYGNRHTASGVSTVTIAEIVSMAQNDTAKITLAVTGDGSDTADFIGGSGFSSFAGVRVG